MLGRVLLGILLIRQGGLGLSDLQHLSRVLGEHNVWNGWPLLGTLRPIELAIWIAAGEFTIGIFLVGGMLTRLAALCSALLALFSLVSLSDLGFVPNLAHTTLLMASLVIVVKGGGAGTMDKALGAMQRRSMERQAERDAEAQAARGGR